MEMILAFVTVVLVAGGMLAVSGLAFVLFLIVATVTGDWFFGID